MEIHLTPDQEAYVRLGVESGRFPSAAAALSQAMEMWVERERRRMELLSMLDDSEASLTRGEGLIVTEETRQQVLDDILKRGRERLAAIQAR